MYLKSAVRYITTGGRHNVKTAGDIDEKTGDSVAEVLKSKQTSERLQMRAIFLHHDETPILTDVDITDDVVEHVAARLTGSAGLVALMPTRLTGCSVLEKPANGSDLLWPI
jgi:hypothetical protein